MISVGKPRERPHLCSDRFKHLQSYLRVEGGPSDKVLFSMSAAEKTLRLITQKPHANVEETEKRPTTTRLTCTLAAAASQTSQPVSNIKPLRKNNNPALDYHSLWFYTGLPPLWTTLQFLFRHWFISVTLNAPSENAMDFSLLAPVLLAAESLALDFGGCLYHEWNSYMANIDHARFPLP
ncbi:hypothetical protein DFH29DRAFT_1068391 [Suillus ampliporus]|nr:hypothetical protein DFH29DRAFT_1068391 [Suillus ampliporus]